MRARALLHGPHSDTHRGSTHSKRPHTQRGTLSHAARVLAARGYTQRGTTKQGSQAQRSQTGGVHARQKRLAPASARRPRSLPPVGVCTAEEVSSGASIKGRTGEEDEGLVTDDGGGCDGGGDGVGREEDHDGGHEEGGQDISGSRGATTVEVITATKLRLR